MSAPTRPRSARLAQIQATAKLLGVSTIGEGERRQRSDAVDALIRLADQHDTHLVNDAASGLLMFSEAAVDFQGVTQLVNAVSASDLERMSFEIKRIAGNEGSDAIGTQIVGVNDVDGSPVYAKEDSTGEYGLPKYDPNDRNYVDESFPDNSFDESRKELMENFELRKLTEMAYAVFGKTAVENITRIFDKRGNRAAAIRAFFEGFSGDQCRGALSRINPFGPGTSTCWICGFVIPEIPHRFNSGYKMECEHVFPIAQAVYFLDLYRGAGTVTQLNEAKIKAEYDWSHRVCNQIKNNKHFIRSRQNGRNKEWYIDDRRIAAFLVELYNRSGLYFISEEGNRLTEDIGVYPGGRDTWLIDRTAVIKDRCENALLIGVDTCHPGILDLIMVAKCYERFETTVLPNISAAQPSVPQGVLAQAKARGNQAARAAAPRAAAAAASRRGKIETQIRTRDLNPSRIDAVGRAVLAARARNTPAERAARADRRLQRGTGRGPRTKRKKGGASRKNGSVVTRSMARRTRRNAK